jgi:hypothetical protein
MDQRWVIYFVSNEEIDKYTGSLFLKICLSLNNIKVDSAESTFSLKIILLVHKNKCWKLHRLL